MERAAGCGGAWVAGRLRPGPPPGRLRYSALTAAVSAARPSFASAKSIPVLGFE